VINPRCAFKHRFDVRRSGLMVIELIAEVFRLAVKVFDKSVDVVFPRRALEAALIEGGIETSTKLICLLLDAANDLFQLLVADAIGLANYLAHDDRSECRGEQNNKRSHA